MLCSNLLIKIIYLIDCLHHISQKIIVAKEWQAVVWGYLKEGIVIA